MKLLSNYLKEMKIAARGFYFYIEIGMAVLLLAILLLVISETSTSSSKQFVYNDMPQKIAEYLRDQSIKDGDARLAGPTEFKLRPVKFEVTNQETGETTAYTFDDKGNRTEVEIPADLKDEAEAVKESLIEVAAEADDALMI